MTAVARIRVMNYPLLMADLLISTPRLSGVTASIPTVDDLAEFLSSSDSKFVPDHLTQKIAVVSDNLIVGWSGDYETARSRIEILVGMSKSGPFTMDSLNAWFDVWGQDTWQGDRAIGLVGFLREPGGRFAQFGRSFSNLRTETFGDVGLLGTGSPTLERRINSTAMPELSIDGNALHHALSYGLLLSGTLLSDEIATHAPLRNHFGGGYEIATLIEGKFRKLDSVAHVFWIARYDGKSQVRLRATPIRALWYAYQDDLLVIRSGVFHDSAERVMVRQTLFPVPPVYRDLTTEEQSNPRMPPLNATWLVNYIIFDSGSDGVNVLVLAKYRARGISWVSFEETSDGIVVGVEEDFLRNVAKATATNPDMQRH